MASSKDKAIVLKDNYVAGLIEGATAPMDAARYGSSSKHTYECKIW